ncbi:hypothetical protein ElP_42620 [Tautonia plasticadhaerens]|uniref:Uncharacterized protein n=1 Tax=Tautonia plasticadhaerens TaxID=2527974 RepID=A0A518H674_9BACT|nr:hypothetical protein ElP_42620 [Tautonia plasticadhaerens]
MAGLPVDATGRVAAKGGRRRPGLGGASGVPRHGSRGRRGCARGPGPMPGLVAPARTGRADAPPGPGAARRPWEEEVLYKGRLQPARPGTGGQSPGRAPGRGRREVVGEGWDTPPAEQMGTEALFPSSDRLVAGLVGRAGWSGRGSEGPAPSHEIWPLPGRATARRGPDSLPRTTWFRDDRGARMWRVRFCVPAGTRSPATAVAPRWAPERGSGDSTIGLAPARSRRPSRTAAGPCVSGSPTPLPGRAARDRGLKGRPIPAMARIAAHRRP